MPYNFVADSFHAEKLCSRLSSSEVRFWTENGRFGGLDWTFLLAVTGEALRANIGLKSAISLQLEPVDPKFQVEGVAHHQPFFFSEN